MRRLRNKRGFTLVEIIVVIVILGVLLGIAIPSVIGYIEKANVQACRSNRAELMRSWLCEKALAYETSGKQAGAAVTLEAVVSGTYPASTDLSPYRVCPSGGTYSVENGRIVCSIASHNAGVAAGYTPETFYPAASDAIAGAIAANRIRTYTYSGIDDANRAAMLGAFSDDMKAYLAGKTWAVKTTSASKAGFLLYIYDGSLTGMRYYEAIPVTVYDPGTQTARPATSHVVTKNKINVIDLN